MKVKYLFLLLISLVLISGTGYSAQSSPDPYGDNLSLKWDRDFDLLIDMEDVPTLAQKKIEERRAALTAERDALRKEIADLDSRIEAVSGTYSNQALLDEMLKLKVSDAESVRKALKDRQTLVRNRIDEIDKILKSLNEAGAG